MKVIALPNDLPPKGSVPETPAPFDPALGLPCRRCQKNSKAGDVIRLISYQHFLPAAVDTPYAHPGPIFVHEDDCPVYAGEKIAEDHKERTFAVKGFTKDHVMRETALATGSETVEELVNGWFEDEIEYVHVHHAGAGCFAFKIEK